MNLRVNGRLTKPVARATANPVGVFIRIDDERNDEFWADVFISLEQLKALLAGVETVECEEDDLAPSYVFARVTTEYGLANWPLKVDASETAFEAVEAEGRRRGVEILVIAEPEEISESEYRRLTDGMADMTWTNEI